MHKSREAIDEQQRQQFNALMENLKLPIDRLLKQEHCGICDRYICPVFRKKIPKGIMPNDYDKKERLIEIEFSDGRRNWIPIEFFFSKVITQAKYIVILFSDGHEEDVHIEGIVVNMVKRTMYMNLVFECDLPF